MAACRGVSPAQHTHLAATDEFLHLGRTLERRNRGIMQEKVSQNVGILVEFRHGSIFLDLSSTRDLK